MSKQDFFNDFKKDKKHKVLKDGMVHISKLSERRVNRVEDVVNIGDMVWVKVTDIDEKGRVNLSLRDAQREIAAMEARDAKKNHK